MKRPTIAALLAFALFAVAAHAQDAQKPAPAADQKQEPAAKPEPGPGQEPDPKILEGIAECLAEGLPQDWSRAWFVVQELDRDEQTATRRFEANFFYATRADDAKGERLRTCGPERIVEGVKALNAYLPASQQRWTSATFTFQRDGRFDAKYDFTPLKPAAEAPKPAPKKPVAKKAAAKKKAEPAK